MSRILNQTQEMARAMQGGVYTGAPAGAPAGANVTQAFPRGDLQTYDSRDEFMRQKMEFLAGQNNAMTPFGQVVATDEDLQWLARKRDTEAEANLDAWVGSNFHSHDVVTRRWLQEVFPEYYEKRERTMVEKAKLALRIKLLLLRGPKNEKDLILMWGLQTGQIPLDRDWDVIGPSQSAPTMSAEQNRFAKGLMTPPRYWSDTERKNNAGGVPLAGGNPVFNPFAPVGGPNQWSGANGQAPAPFSGPAVGAFPGKYPTFLSATIMKAMNPSAGGGAVGNLVNI
jgi:hypothetical protein